MSTRCAIALGVVAVAAASAPGCGADSPTEPDSRPPAAPAQAVAAAAQATFAEPVAELQMAARGEPAPWAGSGLIRFAEGRFRIEAEPARPHRVGAEFVREGATVIGLAGEGFEGTVLETVGGWTGDGEGGQRCWFNPHAPVGFYADPISVEEAVRLSGSIVESLHEEIAGARALGEGRFAVELARSAAEPRDDFQDGERRVWGDRGLIADLSEPIEVVVAGDRVERIAYELIHRPDTSWTGGERQPRAVAIEAAIQPTDAELALDPPQCQAIE